MKHRRNCFWVYSSMNKRGGRTHPVVFHRRDRALDMWARWVKKEAIAAELKIDRTAVDRYIAWAKKNGDPRAQRAAKEWAIVKARIRRRQIKQLHDLGLSTKEIAKQLGVNIRLVQARIQEAKAATLSPELCEGE